MPFSLFRIDSLALSPIAHRITRESLPETPANNPAVRREVTGIRRRRRSMKFVTGTIATVCVIALSSTVALAETKVFKGRVTGVVTPTTVDDHADGHVASLTLSSTKDFTIQRSSENDATGGFCLLPDGSFGGLVQGVIKGALADGTPVRGWEVWNHRKKESSLVIAVTVADTCFGADQAVSVGEGVIVGGTGEFEGATGHVVTGGTNVDTLIGGLQAVQRNDAGPPLVWYFVSIDGEFELTVNLP
jgi:hypothetical protein